MGSTRHWRSPVAKIQGTHCQVSPAADRQAFGIQDQTIGEGHLGI